MGWREDNENAYRNPDGWFGRSIRRGTRKAVGALTLGAFGKDPLTSLAEDAAMELPTAIRRSMEDDDD